jgi:hypothetical protein
MVDDGKTNDAGYVHCPIRKEASASFPLGDIEL